MTDDLQDEFVRNTVRAHLRARNVKLWIHPYVNEQGGPNINILESLAEEYFQQLNLDKKDCLYMLTTLQDNALMRLREQEQFSSGGVATLYIRYSGFSVHHSGSSVDPLPSTSMTNYIQDTKSQAQLEISVNATGKDLIDAISQLSGKSPEQIKLVFSGRIIDKDKNLLTQGVKSSSRILAIALTPSDQIKEFEEDQAHEKFCEKTRSAAQILSKENNEFSSFQLEGQTGHALKLDRREKEAICLALAFHERGRAKLKRGDHSFALLLFLEADKEFERCDSDLLKSVDNVALLQLDIVWCYLCLRSMSHIPDADRRLNQCEIILERSYGKNLERVEALKDSAGIKGALLMRLHLLQAIVAFHLYKIGLSKELLRKAENELESLLVNTDDIAKIAALGYSTSEALLGLRACQGNLDAAVSKICEWQEERKRAREQNRKDEEKERERARLGRTADGSRYIEPDCVQTLCGMGYDRDLAICALKHSNNSMSQAVHLLQEQRHLLDVKRKCVKISDEEVTQIAAMGFDVDISRHALRKHNGCVEEAINDLVNNGGIISLEQDQLLPEEYDHNINNPPASSSESSLNEKSRKAEEDRKTEKRKQMEASKELENDISDEQYDYLSLTLEEEKKFLIEYKTLLNL